MGDRHDNSDGCTVFVGSLNYEVTEDDMRDVFEKYGQVESVRIITDRETGKPRGFGFVTLSSKDEAEEAVRGCDGQEILGRAVKCNISKPGGGRSRGGGGGGFSRGGGGFNRGQRSYNDRDNRSYDHGSRNRGGGGSYRSQYSSNSYGSQSHGGGY